MEGVVRAAFLLDEECQSACQCNGKTPIRKKEQIQGGERNLPGRWQSKPKDSTEGTGRTALVRALQRARARQSTRAGGNSSFSVSESPWTK